MKGVLLEQYKNSQAYFNFINSLKSKFTKETYRNNLLKFMNHYQLKDMSSLLSLPVEDLRDKIVKYFLEKREASKSSQKVMTASLKHFCEMNDIILNWKKITKFIFSDVPKSEDRAYAHEEIRQILEHCDHRLTATFLVLASSGIRPGV